MCKLQRCATPLFNASINIVRKVVDGFCARSSHSNWICFVLKSLPVDKWLPYQWNYCQRNVLSILTVIIVLNGQCFVLCIISMLVIMLIAFQTTHNGSVILIFHPPVLLQPVKFVILLRNANCQSLRMNTL